MRKAIIAAIVATALFAVGAFAASFTVQSEDIASGADSVDSCAELARVSFEDPTSPTAAGGAWTLNEATVTFYGDTGATTDAPACVNFDANLVLELDTNDDGAADSFAPYGEVAVTGGTGAGSTTAVFALSSTDAAQIVGANVLVDDAVITTATTAAAID